MAWGNVGSADQATQWTTADLAAVYSTQSHALTRRALRYLRDEQQAQEVVQEAFIKVMLAAPELNDLEHLTAYLNKTVTNLCLNIRRSQGRGPLLVAVDSDTSEAVLAELAAESHVDLDDSLTRADDVAIIREALSRLSDADRAILMAREIEQKSTEQIAAEFGIKESTVRNALYRARRNLRTILDEWIVDEESGLTASQMLSRSYAKIAENSKKIGSAALSLVLLAAAFLGFWNNPASAPTITATPQVTLEPTPSAEATTTPEADATATPEATASTKPTATPDSTASDLAVVDSMQKSALAFLSTMGLINWPGLDANGIPLGFTVNDGATVADAALVNQTLSFQKNGAIVAGSDFITTGQGANVLLAQKTTYLNGRLAYAANPMVRVNGAWVGLEAVTKSVKVEAKAGGNWLITAFYIVDVEATKSGFVAQGLGLGADLKEIPGVIATRLLVTPNGQPVLGQSVQVLAPVAGQ